MNKTIISILILLLSFTANAQNCGIGALNVDILPCESNGKFYVTLNFNYENTGKRRIYRTRQWQQLWYISIQCASYNIRGLLLVMVLQLMN